MEFITPLPNTNKAQNIVVLGSTGSVGTQALDVLQRFPSHYSVFALSANNNMGLLAKQIMQFKPKAVVVKNIEKQQELEALLPEDYKKGLNIFFGPEGLNNIASEAQVQVVLNAIVGFAGLSPTFAALKANKKVLTGNKETMVCAGHLLKPYLSQIIPLDSEHSAIYQCLEKHNTAAIRKIYLTASGGPFLSSPLNTLDKITPEMALSHPNWQMGQRITIDCATMVNKGFEWVEASVLFSLPMHKIEVVVHPQSKIHSAVAYEDGNMIAQLGTTDMRLPIVYGLSTPQRWTLEDNNLHLDLTQLCDLTFLPVEPERYPCLAIVKQAAELGHGALTVINAVDEILVQQFLDEKIAYLDIAKWLAKALVWAEENLVVAPDLDEVIALDQQARGWISQQLQLALV